MNPLEFMQTSLFVVWSFGVIFIFCSCGEMMTSEFDMISNELNQCKWYLLPLKVQELFLIFVANSQQAQFIQGYANIICTRETFQIVSLICASYKKFKCVIFSL